MNLKSITLFSGIFLFFGTYVFAQDTLPVPTNIEKTYQRGTRSPDGTPGKNYWQNKADYDIHITFTPETRLIAGTENIVYTNNSPDTLKMIWFKLYPNYYKKGGERSSLIQPQDVSSGVHISKMIINGQQRDAGRLQVLGTNMIIAVPEILPGKNIKFTIDFSYTLNKTSHVRTGEIEDGAYFIAYFFPRIAVYDDIDGWNRYQYTGTQEFYNDFCHFNVAINVPKDYVVWATGTLQNPDEVFKTDIIQLIQQAEKSDDVTTIIDSTDIKQHDVTTDHFTNTWKFEANDVTDFVFATSNHYMWQSSSLVVDPQTGRRTRVDAVFNPKHTDYFSVINFARKTVQAMSYTFPAWPYPYPHETVFDGLDQMEYPMMVNDNPLTNRYSTIELTDHEIFHTMFPFYMGTNETKYAWMDEGWATIGEWVISPIIDSTDIDYYGMEPYDRGAGSEVDLPIMTLSTEESGATYYLDSYPKPAMGYYYLRDMLGDSLFTKALHYYIEQWHGKHPMPYDFFNCINKGAGENLNWFWKKWFFDRGVPDLKIDKVIHHGNKYEVTILSVGSKPVPIDLFFHFDDGTSQNVHRSIAVWENGNKKVMIRFTSEKTVKKITLGSTYDADVNKADNTYDVN